MPYLFTFTIFLSALASICSAQAEETRGTPIPLQLMVKMYAGTYSPETTCTERVLAPLKITPEECKARVEKAKLECPAQISIGLPAQLDEKQAFILVGRSRWCLTKVVIGQQYRNEDFDPLSEKMWHDHTGGG